MSSSRFRQRKALKAERGRQPRQRGPDERHLVRADPADEVVFVRYRQAYSMATAVFPTPPRPCRACGSDSSDGRTAVILLAKRRLNCARMSSRPVKFLFRRGTPSQIRGTPLAAAMNPELSQRPS